MYLKQYLTPTIILKMNKYCVRQGFGGKEAYHKLVKTTPKPRATKNKSGELVGPELLLLFPLLVGEGEGGVEVVAGVAMVAREGVSEVV